jgi:hypothetical protein
VTEIGTTAGFSGDEHFDEANFDGESRAQVTYRRWSGPTPGDDEPQLVKSNLTRYRWRHEVDGSEDRDLLRLAKAGNDSAKIALAQNYHRLVLKIANEYYGPPLDERIGAGVWGLCEAIARFDLRRNTGFGTYAEYRIRWAIRELVKQWRNRGNCSDTRADRFLFDNPDATAEDIARKLGCSLRDAEAAIVRKDGYWNGHDYYSTTGEAGYSDDTDHGRRIENDDVSRETSAAGAPAPMRAMYQQFDPFRRSPQLRLHKHDGPIGRLLDFERLQTQSDRRVIERIKQIGRRSAANEAVDHERAAIAARSNPALYLYRNDSPLMDRLSKTGFWTAELIGVEMDIRQKSGWEIEIWKLIERERLEKISKQIERQKDERERKRRNEASRVPGPGSVSAGRKVAASRDMTTVSYICRSALARDLKERGLLPETVGA